MSKKNKAFKPTTESRTLCELIEPEETGSAIMFRAKRTGRCVDATITLADCSRTISWGFDIYGPDDPEVMKERIDQKIRKLDRMVVMLDVARGALKGMYARAAIAPVPPRKKPKKLSF